MEKNDRFERFVKEVKSKEFGDWLEVSERGHLEDVKGFFFSDKLDWC